MRYTGERFIPDEGDPLDELSVEHQQRYRSIGNIVSGKVVLDAGSGEGYGTDLLAASAGRVVGIDISVEAVRHARAAYRKKNLDYLVGTVASLPFTDHSFDVVVSFEVIEHLDEESQASFLLEARRVLTDQGVLVISTPNKSVYTDRTGLHNVFHKREFLPEEFESFLRGYFSRVSLFGQSWVVSSLLGRPESRHLESLGFTAVPRGEPKYVLAVCSASEVVDPPDVSATIVEQHGKFESMWRRIVDLQAEVESKNSWVLSTKEELHRTESVLLHYKDEAEELAEALASARTEIEQIKTRLAETEQTARARATEITILESQAVELRSRIASLQNVIKGKDADLAILRGELEDIKRSDFWKIASRYWLVRDAVLPPGSRRRRLIKSAFYELKRGIEVAGRWIRRDTSNSVPGSGAVAETRSIAHKGGVEARDLPLEFRCSETPEVSIIVPAFNQWEHTYRCLKSIRETLLGVPCEVILADDRSTDATQGAEEVLIGVRLMHGSINRGFLRNCNWAAGEARGKYLYFLNNDTELQHGAIQALLSLMEREPAIGMAGSKLIYPDGRLQEAGGILWADGSGWNFGRGQNPALPAFNYVKEVDYVSGASFMIRNELWRAIGGFDERFAPAYCEDSDLAFEVRKRGFKVVYQPQSVVIHFEGASHGTDDSQSTKAHQVRNTETLRTKWAEALSRQFPNGTDVFHARDRSVGKNSMLLIDHYVPQFDRDAGSRTIWSFIQVFLKMGFNVKFLGDNFYPHQPYTDILQQAGVEVLTGPWFADNWPEWLAENGNHFDFVFMNRPHIAPKYLNAVRAHTKARIFYYVHDLHYLRESKLAEITADDALRSRVEQAKREEQHLMSRMDVIFSCSCSETEIIRELCPGMDVFYVPPYSVDVNLWSRHVPEKRAGLLFVGGFSHPPNVDGVLWFVRDVWPAVRSRIPGAVFTIVGSEPPPEVRALAAEDVRVLGFVTDDRLEELYAESRLAVIPLRYGGGVKGKTVEAMAHGVPVAGTVCAFEGMPGIENSIDPMQSMTPLADAIVALYGDCERLSDISMKQRIYVSRQFNLESIEDSFTKAISAQAEKLRARQE